MSSEEAVGEYSEAVTSEPASRTSSMQHSISESSYQSPLRHHHRATSSHKRVKETRNARSQYSNSEDDGTSQLRINQYVIGQEIGRGSFGAVHLATDEDGHEYAVKEFSKTRLRRRAKSNLLRRPRTQGPRSDSLPHLYGGTTGLHHYVDKYQEKAWHKMGYQDNSFDLIKEEIAIMKKLNHNNLVSLIEVLDDPDDDSLFMVLEMCKKGVIMKVEVDQAADPYDEESCRHWFRDLILGIEYLHAQGIVHRDIKPDNCLLAEDDTLKIVDFGVSEMFEKEAEMKIAKSAGSPAFMAPELCKVNHGSVAGKPADIWSMGVTLYCLRFGKVPFAQHAVLDLYKSILNDEVHLPSDCNPDLVDLLKRIFDKDPETRIKMEELREHPWVTKQGSDPLLPASENCAHPIEPPTEAEMNAAITSNLARFMATMKAVHRFKALFERRHPELVGRVLGRASRLVRSPVPGSRSDTNLPMQPTKEPEVMSADDIKSVEQMLQEMDTKNDKEAMEMKRLLEHIKSEEGTTSASPTMDGTFEPQPGIRKVMSEPIEGHRGHAHDVTLDRLYLSIGTGPIGLTEHTDGEEDYIVSESPPPTDYNVYEKAYKKEVQEIIKRRGRQTTVYLTRRVDDKKAEVLDLAYRGLERHQGTIDSAKAGIANVVGKILPHRSHTSPSSGAGTQSSTSGDKK